MITRIELLNQNFKSLTIENNGPASVHEGDAVENVITVPNWYDSPLASVAVNYRFQDSNGKES